MTQTEIQIRVDNLSKEAKQELMNVLEKYEMTSDIYKTYGHKDFISFSLRKKKSYITEYLNPEHSKLPGLIK